jgi:secreted trypsin-like serine protease
MIHRSIHSRSAVACLSLFVLMAALPAAASAPAHTYPRIINGQPVAVRSSPIVEVRRSFQGAVALCSAVVIAPRAVLTAAHCVQAPRRTVRVIRGGRSYAVRAVKIDPDFSVAPSGLPANDLAVLQLSRRIPGPRLSLLVSREVQVGDTVTIIGYGITETGQVGLLRQGQIQVSAVTPQHVVTAFNLPTESDTCNGDSGSPAILSYTDGNGIGHTGIVGITSTGTSPTCALGDLTFFINTQNPSVVNYITGNAPATGLS